jgi:4-hydroxybenzoyl-CoA reductase subunit beta
MKYEGEICHVVPTSKRCYAAYSGDIAPALLVLHAEINITGPKGTRRVPLAELFNDDGINYLTLNDGEMVSAVHLPGTMATPPGSGAASSYAKLRIRASIDFPLAGIALRIALSNSKLTAISAAITGTKSIPIAITGLDTFIGKSFDSEAAGNFAKLIQKQISPLHTTTIQPQYRRRAVAAMARTMAFDLIRSENT